MVTDIHRYGALPEEWNHFAVILGLDEDLLPCVSDPNAPISLKSKMKKVGKTPSVYNSYREARGMPEWTTKKSTLEEIDQWEQEADYGICLQTRHIRAIDCDITNAVVAARMMKLIFALSGHILPVRMRNNSSKFVVAFRLEGEFGKRTIKTEHGIIEFLANGQQFVAAGTHDSGVRYEWVKGLPAEFPTISAETYEKIFEELTKNFAIEPPVSESKTRNAKLGEPGQFGEDPVLQFLEAHNHVLSTGREGELRITCPWKADHSVDSGETETTYFVAGTRGYKQGHFKCLHAHCATKTDDDFLSAFGYGMDDYEDVSTPEDVKVQEKKRHRFKPIRADDYLNRPPVEWQIKGILPKRSAGMTFGGSGDGKTFAVLDQAIAVALGVDWNGRKTKQGKVTYVCAEGAGGFMTRIQAYAQHHGISLKNLGDWFAVVPAAPNFMTKDDVLELAAQINKHHPDTAMVIIDTLAQTSTGGDESSAKDMNIMLANVRLLRDHTGCISHLVHHIGKDEAKGARGSTTLKADCDFQFSIAREGNRRLWWCEKMKDGVDNFGWHFILSPIEIGLDEDGDVITSCVVEYEEAQVETKSKGKGRKKTGEWEERILTAWESLGGGEAAVQEVLEEAKSITPAVPGKTDRRMFNLARAITSLAKTGQLTIRDGKIFDTLETGD